MHTRTFLRFQQVNSRATRRWADGIHWILRGALVFEGRGRMPYACTWRIKQHPLIPFPSCETLLAVIPLVLPIQLGLCYSRFNATKNAHEVLVASILCLDYVTKPFKTKHILMPTYGPCITRHVPFPLSLYLPT